MYKKIIYILTIFIAMLLLHCVSVKSYEKERVTSFIMTEDSDNTENSFQAHWSETLEAAQTSLGNASGGCACD